MYGNADVKKEERKFLFPLFFLLLNYCLLDANANSLIQKVSNKIIIYQLSKIWQPRRDWVTTVLAEAVL